MVPNWALGNVGKATALPALTVFTTVKTGNRSQISLGLSEKAPTVGRPTSPRRRPSSLRKGCNNPSRKKVRLAAGSMLQCLSTNSGDCARAKASFLAVLTWNNESIKPTWRCITAIMSACSFSASRSSTRPPRLHRWWTRSGAGCPQIVPHGHDLFPWGFTRVFQYVGQYHLGPRARRNVH